MNIYRQFAQAMWLEKQANLTAQGRRWRDWREQTYSQSASLVTDYLPVILTTGGALVGVGFMTGLLLVNAAQTANVLLILAFAVLAPMIIKLVSWLWPKHTGPRPWQQHKVLVGLALATFQLASSTAAIMAFLFWLLATDITFVWQSTLLAGSQEMAQWLNVLAWPWQWFWPQAMVNQALLEASQSFTQSQSTVATLVAAPWWQYLLACMLFWVWLPRVIDYGWWRWQAQRTLQAIESGPNHRRLQSSQFSPVPKQAPAVDYYPAAMAPAPEDAPRFQWRTGGDTDLAKLSFAQACQQLTSHTEAVVITLSASVTPTAELADICRSKPGAGGWLQVAASGQDADLESWQQFVARHLPDWHLEVV